MSLVYLLTLFDVFTIFPRMTTFRPGRVPHLQLRVPLLRVQLQPRGLPQQAPGAAGKGQHQEGGGAHHQLHFAHPGTDYNISPRVQWIFH